MTFYQAVKKLMKGNFISRESWYNEERAKRLNIVRSFISLKFSDNMNDQYIYKVEIRCDPSTNEIKYDEKHWNPTQLDLLAKDWIIEEYITSEEKEMKNYIHRITIIPEAGLGNPYQYKLIPVYKKGNHDLFAINVDNNDENFVLFTRTKPEYRQYGPTIFNSNDILNIVDYIYDLAARVFDERDGYDIKYTFEIDFGNDDILNEVQLNKLFDLNSIKYSMHGPGVDAFLSVIEADRKHYNREPNFNFIFKKFSMDDCKLYFFNNCEHYGTPSCCKFRK